MDFTIAELEVPQRLDSPAGADFAAMIEVRNLVEADSIGSEFLSYTAAEMLPVWQNQRYEPKRSLVARVDGRIVAHGLFEIEVDPGADAAFIEIEVLPEFRGMGIGDALFDRLLEWTREADLAVMQAFAMYPPVASGAQITAPTGYGSVPSGAPATLFLRRLGFTLEQVERISLLPLPGLEAVAGLEAEALRSADEYRVVLWEGRTPEQYVAGMAHLRRRMSVDAPSAALSFAEQEWDAERIAANDDVAEHSSRSLLVAAAQHRATGSLVGFTELSVPATTDRPVDQGDTLVVREHRGSHLGLVLKIANLRQLDERYPGHPSIVTFNAEENRYMLDVNERMGFVPMAYGAAWQKSVVV